MNINSTAVTFGIIGMLSLWSTLFILFSGEGIFVYHEQNEIHREALVKIRAELSLGMRDEDVLDKYWKIRTDRLKLHADQSEYWIITTPAEILASEWMLSLEFDNGILEAIKVRSGDGPKPIDAPEDIHQVALR